MRKHFLVRIYAASGWGTRCPMEISSLMSMADITRLTGVPISIYLTA